MLRISSLNFACEHNLAVNPSFFILFLPVNCWYESIFFFILFLPVVGKTRSPSRPVNTVRSCS